MDTVRRKLEFPPEDEFSILKLLPVVRKEPLVKMHRSEAEFLSNQTAKKLKLSPTKDVKDNTSIPTMQLAKRGCLSRSC